MEDRQNSGKTEQSAENEQEYNHLLLLDDLESLLEEAEGAEVTGRLSASDLPDEARQLAAELGVQSIADVRQRILELHAKLDEAEVDEIMEED
ncbi:MAG: hypothetical protein ABI670_00610 [Chloroflexota bacterium]